MYYIENKTKSWALLCASLNILLPSCTMHSWKSRSMKRESAGFTNCCTKLSSPKKGSRLWARKWWTMLRGEISIKNRVLCGVLFLHILVVLCVNYLCIIAWYILFLDSMKREGRTVTKTLIRDIAFTKGEDTHKLSLLALLAPFAFWITNVFCVIYYSFSKLFFFAQQFFSFHATMFLCVPKRTWWRSPCEQNLL